MQKHDTKNNKINNNNSIIIESVIENVQIWKKNNMRVYPFM